METKYKKINGHWCQPINDVDDNLTWVWDTKNNLKLTEKEYDTLKNAIDTINSIVDILRQEWDYRMEEDEE